MSGVPRCTVCDSKLNPWGQDTRCDRCKQPCPTCGGDVAHCSHPLPVEPLSDNTFGTVVQGDPLLRKDAA